MKNVNNGSLVMSPKDFGRVCRSSEKGWHKLEIMYRRMTRCYQERKSIEDLELNKSLEHLNLLDFV